MNKGKSSGFGRYIKSSKVIRRDYLDTLDDLRFLYEERGTIYYAVDFSEIYSYVLPGETFREFMPFSGESEDVAQTRQTLALKLLFFGKPQEPLVLLRPYAIELDAFLIRSREETFFDTLKTLPYLIEETEKTAESA